MKIEKTPYHSLKAGQLCKGCQSCVKGEKLVIFVTGVCPAHCFYCPISPEKKQQDVIYANERPVRTAEDLLAEARASNATGASFTGGDPLARLERTCTFIRQLKRAFGHGFHLHLYTPLNLVTKERLAALHAAGLDEIRFHPFLNKQEWWPRIELARAFSWSVGVEIPVLPDKVEEIKELLSFLDGKIDFLNLNELEISELNETSFQERGYHPKSFESYGVAGCDDAARALIQHVIENGYSYPVHYCTCKLKDLVQMGNRLKRRAATTKLPFDIVDEDGMVTRGAIYHELLPGAGYEKTIEHLSTEARQAELAALKQILPSLQEHGLTAYQLDEWKPRILVPPAWLVTHASNLEWPAALVTEYPTFDSFPLKIEFLNGELREENSH